MLGLFIGDTAGSFREFSKTKHPELPLMPDLPGQIGLTDDSILALATAFACDDARARGGDPTAQDFAAAYHRMGREIPCTIGGYGGMFSDWLFSDGSKPYGSFGNGSAMRVGPVVLFADTLEECDQLATASATATHNHPEGVKGARVTALMTWLYAHGEADPESIIHARFGLRYGRSAGYDHFDAICQETMPLALHCLDVATSFEDAIFLAVTVPNADSDTLGAIVGTIAEARWGVPDHLKDRMLSLVQPELKAHMDRFLKIATTSRRSR